MKRFFLFALVATVFAACSTDTTQDLAPEIPTAPDELQVSFDEEDTRIQLQNNVAVWTEGDLVSVFYRSNANDKWQFQGKTGDTAGTLKRIEATTATQATTKIVAVYPYSKDYWFNWNTGDVEASLPAEQTYLKDSFGLDGTIMVSQSDYNQLSFKNVCGWLKLQFTGTGYVSKIVLKGNNGEQVAGKIYINTEDASCTLAAEMGGTNDEGIGGTGGTLIFDDTILTFVTLNCGDGVALNQQAATAFYVALPPQTFEKGFTATIYGCDGSTKEISTENSITIERNHILPMASATLEMPIPSNQIWYTSSDGNVVEPNATDVFGANITSNTYKNGVGVITFDGDVTTIGNSAFRYCKALTSVTIPDSVTSIGGWALYNCSALTSVTIPDSVTEIGVWAFRDCNTLTSVTIPDSVTTIGSEAFWNCDALTSVTIPDSVTTIGDSAFAFCDALKAFYGKFASKDNRCLIVDGVLNSFAPAGLTTYSIPDSVTTIGEYAFYYCRALTSVTIPDSVTTIGSSAFYSCDALTSVTIPDSVTTIGSSAFYYCDALTSVTIPDSVTTIGGSAFASCSALKAFYGKFASEDNRCLIVNGVLNSFAPAGLTTYSIPDSVTEIGVWAFGGCSALTSVTIPDSVTTIGSYAFNGCDALKEVYCKPTTPPNLSAYSVFGNNASDRKIYVPTASVDAYKAADGWKEYADAIVAMPIPSNEIWYTSSDGNVVEPNATDVFGANIVSNTYENGVGVITFDGDITTIGEEAFLYCSALTSIKIPNSVTSIGKDAFLYCSALTSIKIPNSVTSIGWRSFCDCSALTSITIPDNVTYIENYTFNGCSSLTSITIPNSVTKIGEGAFTGCDALQAFYGKFASADNRCLIVDGVLNAFAIGCGLTEYTIPYGITSIRYYAFGGCSTLTSITIPNSVTLIEKGAFSGCKTLKEVFCKPTTPPNLGGSYVFDYNASDRKIYVPTASVDVYKAASRWNNYASAIEPYNFTE